MRNKKSLLLLLSLCSLFVLSLFPITTKGQADIPYTFDTDVLFTENDITVFDDSTNKLSNAKNASTYTNHYNATYSFEDGFPDDWTNVDGADCDTFVINSLINHSDIMRFRDNSVGNVARADFDITQSLDTVIEFWVTKSSIGANTDFFVQIREGGVRVVYLRFQDNDVDYRNELDAFVSIKDNFLLTTAQFHIKVVQDDSANTFDLYVNNILEGSGLNDNNNSTLGLDNVIITTDGTDTGYSGYIDAFGISTDVNYNVGDNFIPYSIVNTSIKEVDRWEFAYSSFEVLYPIGSDTFSDWTEVDTVADLVNTGANPLWGADRVVAITHFAPVIDILGIKRDFSEHGNILNITWQLEFQDFGGFGNEFQMQVFSFDGTIVSDIFFEDSQLKYNPGGIILEILLTDNEIYTLNLYINYNDELSVLRFSIDGVLISVNTIPLMSLGEEGINEVRCLVDGSPADDMDVDLDYVGVYVNDTSLSTEFGHLRIDEVVPFVGFPSNVWNFNEFNLVNFDMVGNSSIWVSEGPAYFIGLSIISQIVSEAVYSEPDTANVYGLADFGPGILVSDPILWFQFYNQFQFNEVEIGGVRLIEGTDEHILEFTFGNVDPNESYFYVDTSNRLQFRHTADDSNLEFIQARFNINDNPSNDSAIFFRSVITDRALGFFRVNFTTVSNLFPLVTSEGNSRIILSQGLTIRDYIVLITDNDNDDISGLTTGYVSNVELIFITNIDVTLITTSLIDIMIPLVMIIIPTLGISARVGKNGIIPIFLLMSLLLVVTEIIPVWLFFVIGVSSALFIFIKRREVIF